MNLKLKNAAGRSAALLGLLTLALAARGQTYAPAHWVNDPFCTNQNFAITGAGTASPTFANDGAQRGTVYGNSPIGATLDLTDPGDTISCTGQVVIAGDINPDGNLQFRLGLYCQGTNATDTNWLGYMFGNPTGTGGAATTGLYVRKNPNAGIFSSGATGNTTQPACNAFAYSPGWGAGTYDFSLAVTALPGRAQSVIWKLAGVAPNTYSYTGAYTNSTALTAPPAFDQVGVLLGAALFSSASTADTIGFKNVAVTLAKAGDQH